MDFANSVLVESLDLVSFRDPPVETHNVTDGRSGGVATSIADMDRIWRVGPSDIGTPYREPSLQTVVVTLFPLKISSFIPGVNIQL